MASSNRLDLENFTGNGAEVVRQDCHARLYLTSQAQEPPDAREVRHPETVNRSVFFNALKNQTLDLLLGTLETVPLLERLMVVRLRHGNDQIRRASLSQLANQNNHITYATCCYFGTRFWLTTTHGETLVPSRFVK